MNIDQLLAPISAAQPCGEDIAFSSELDAIAKARQADDPSIEQGEWLTTLKEADWRFVASRCATLIEARSKDLKLAVWLAEAGAKTAGYRGLGDGLRLIAALCERYWEHVFPLPDEGGVEQRVGNLCWIATHAPQLVLEVPLTEGVGCAYSMVDFEAARTRPVIEGDTVTDMDAARRRCSRLFYETLLEDAAYCLASIAELSRVVDERLGADGPGFSATRSALENVVHFVTPCAREAGVMVGDETAVEVAEAQGGVVRADARQAQTRAQALAQLRAVAEFFRRTEPHSPVAYLADKAATWGEQPLHVWLRGVVKDQAVCGQLEELLGVQGTP